MFNQHSRTENVAKTSLVGTICKLANIILGFVYRTIFIHILSASYLGINGLFSNILQILSFADLGISSVIVFRFYEPISRNDSYKIGQLMNFFKSVYRIIALIIFIAGMSLLPFLKFFIRDTSELPQDINLQLIYLLFLFQTISSYLFVYKQTILNADQRQYITNLVETVTTLIRYILQLCILLLTKSYTLTLSVNILLNLLSNIIFSEWVSHKYKGVFDVKENISSIEKREILNDTKATLCHKIGGTVLNSTDNIILSKWVGLIATGIYSNYSMVISSLSGILSQLLGSFTSSLGSEHVEHEEKQRYTNYRRLLFANFWVTSVCTVCLFNLLNDFIVVWIGSEMLLDELTLVVLCIQFFVENARIISLSYTNGCGLFVRDKIRPVIEAAINIAVSIVLAKMMGIAGVFIGTIVSHVCTVFWREPYLLYKYEFKRGMKEYWIYYGTATLITLVISLLMRNGISKLQILQVENIYEWIFKALCVFISCNLILIVLLHRSSDFLFYHNLVNGRLKKRMARKNKPIIVNGGGLSEVNITGIPRYVHEVIKHIDESDEASDLDIRICYPSGININVGELKRIKKCPLDKNGKKFRLQVLRKYVKEQNGISCTFANDIQLNRDGIVCIHDIRPLDTGIYDTSHLKREFLLLKYSVKLMHSTIVTVSEFSKERICRVLKVPKNKVYVIPNGWEHIMRIEEDMSIFARIHNIQKGNYFYSIGSVAKHKNFKWIYEVAKRNPDEIFVIAGNIDREFWGTDDSEMKVANLIFCGYVSDEENVALMKNCKAFLFPSKYEGFGIPPLEALALGKKIIVSNATCLPEIFGNSAVYFDPDNYDVDLESMMKQEVYDGDKVLNKYTWENAAKLWINLFKEKQG